MIPSSNREKAVEKIGAQVQKNIQGSADHKYREWCEKCKTIIIMQDDADIMPEKERWLGNWQPPKCRLVRYVYLVLCDLFSCKMSGTATCKGVSQAPRWLGGSRRWKYGPCQHVSQPFIHHCTQNLVWTEVESLVLNNVFSAEA